MDSLESLPPEDSDVYIPNLSSVQAQNSSSSPVETSLQQSMQMSAIRYASPAAAAAAATGVPPALVAAQAPSGPLIHSIYRTTLTTQVIAAQTLAQTFHYPPTPPIDGNMEAGEKRHLQSSEAQALTPSNQGVIEGEVPANVGYEKPMNPFPSPLPTPPDVEAMHSQNSRGMSQQQQQHQQQHQQQQHQQHQQHQSGEELQSPALKGMPHIHQQWTPSSMPYFMSQTSTSNCGPLVPYNGNVCHGSGLGLAARRGCLPGHMPSLQQMYPGSLTNGSMGVVNGGDPLGSSSAMMGDMLKKMPAIPALVKDGKASCIL